MTTTPAIAHLLVLAPALAELTTMIAALEGDHITVPTFDDGTAGWSWESAGELERWRDEAGSGPPADRVVVAAWAPGPTAPAALVDLDDAGFAARVERSLAVWLAAFAAATRRCADGGAIVAVVERPPPLDAAGWAPESGVADAVEAWVRSLARSEGVRGVRVNAVTAPGRVVAPVIVAPPPSLSSFPGSVDHEVLEAVRMLLGRGVAGVTGTVVHADCGRSWR